MVLEPLNLQMIFVNYFAGSMVIFYFITMGVLAYLAAKFRMPNVVTILMMGLFIVLFQNYYPLLYVVAIFVAGLLIYEVLARYIKT